MERGNEFNYLEEDTRKFLKEQIKIFISNLKEDTSNEYILKEVIKKDMSRDLADDFFHEIINQDIVIKGTYNFRNIIKDIGDFMGDELDIKPASLLKRKDIIIKSTNSYI